MKKKVMTKDFHYFYLFFFSIELVCEQLTEQMRGKDFGSIWKRLYTGEDDGNWVKPFWDGNGRKHQIQYVHHLIHVRKEQSLLWLDNWEEAMSADAEVSGIFWKMVFYFQLS